ncbi:hypothetical protein DFP72DRAFT_1137452 [Ephemerocybe angulata]|uniref:Uncharacterized protein n=1 Tax=Ephemerocybe angulata TaxID=980116 RepID=A0A8H6HRI9_9AGAR|nr:hypothetical protein DFP72DRAFT_1137452 [Tulosesus angulatus]
MCPLLAAEAGSWYGKHGFGLRNNGVLGTRKSHCLPLQNPESPSSPFAASSPYTSSSPSSSSSSSPSSQSETVHRAFQKQQSQSDMTQQKKRPCPAVSRRASEPGVICARINVKALGPLAFCVVFGRSVLDFSDKFSWTFTEMSPVSHTLLYGLTGILGSEAQLTLPKFPAGTRYWMAPKANKPSRIVIAVGLPCGPHRRPPNRAHSDGIVQAAVRLQQGEFYMGSNSVLPPSLNLP